jgi:hypothetical protein
MVTVHRKEIPVGITMGEADDFMRLLDGSPGIKRRFMGPATAVD